MNNECKGFIRGSKHRETDESMRLLRGLAQLVELRATTLEVVSSTVARPTPRVLKGGESAAFVITSANG